jgi:hypothetical protein
LVFSVTQSNKVGVTETKVTAYSASTEPVADFPTILTDAVINPPDGFGVADRPNVGTVWSVGATWKKPFPVQSYRWFTCVSKVSAAPESLAGMPQDCVEISGATSANYTIRLADRGKYLLAVVTGTNAAGAVVSITKSTVDPVDQPPVADPLPMVSGERSGGQTLTASKGTWTPSETVVSYRWYACESPVLTTVSEIPGTCSQRDESSASYTQSEEFDGGKYITAYVSGKFGKATSGYLIASTVGTRLGPNIPAGNSKPILDYDSFLIGNLFTVVTGQLRLRPTSGIAVCSQWLVLQPHCLRTPVARKFRERPNPVTKPVEPTMANTFWHQKLARMTAARVPTSQPLAKIRSMQVSNQARWFPFLPTHLKSNRILQLP